MASFFSFYEGNNYRIHYMCGIGNYFREFSNFPLSKSRSAVISPPGARDAMIHSVTGEKPKRSATLQKLISSSPGGMGNLPSRLSFGVDYSIKPRFATVTIPSRRQARPLSLSRWGGGRRIAHVVSARRRPMPAVFVLAYASVDGAVVLPPWGGGGGWVLEIMHP